MPGCALALTQIRKLGLILDKLAYKLFVHGIFRQFFAQSLRL